MILKYKDLGTALSKNELKNVVGGKKVIGGGPLCLGCTSDDDCRKVNKGTCSASCTNNEAGSYPGCTG
jgi:bacteriocin-like protein